MVQILCVCMCARAIIDSIALSITNRSSIAPCSCSLRMHVFLVTIVEHNLHLETRKYTFYAKYATKICKMRSSHFYWYKKKDMISFNVWHCSIADVFLVNPQADLFSACDGWLLTFTEQFDVKIVRHNVRFFSTHWEISIFWDRFRTLGIGSF